MPEYLRVYEIFDSINGEVCDAGQGSLTTFIRLAGCNLNCHYCDTKKAQNLIEGQLLDIKDIVKEVSFKNVTITGGEPLLQKEVLLYLIAALNENGKKVSIETNGSILWKPSQRCSFVMDYKLPSSGENDKIPDPELFTEWVSLNLSSRDWLKFVISDTADFRLAESILKKLKDMGSFVNTAFSPCAPKMTPKKLLDWMIEDRVNAVLNVQLHKLINVQ